MKVIMNFKEYLLERKVIMNFKEYLLESKSISSDDIYNIDDMHTAIIDDGDESVIPNDFAKLGNDIAKFISDAEDNDDELSVKYIAKFKKIAKEVKSMYKKAIKH